MRYKFVDNSNYDGWRRQGGNLNWPLLILSNCWAYGPGYRDGYDVDAKTGRITFQVDLVHEPLEVFLSSPRISQDLIKHYLLHLASHPWERLPAYKTGNVGDIWEIK